MSKRWVLAGALASAGFVFLAPAGPAVATCLDFPDRTVVRGTGVPAIQSWTFSKSNPFAVPVLQVDNGLADGKARCSSGSVTLNGAVVFATSSFNQQVGIGVLSAPVALQAENSLKVEIDGAPGCRVTIRIIDRDAAPPQLVVQSPVSGAVLHVGDDPTAWGTVDDPSAKVSVDGVACGLAGTSFSCAGFGLAKGSDLLVFTATDSCGNESDVYVPVSLEESATGSPSVKASSPGSGTVADEESPFTALAAGSGPLGVPPLDPPACYDFPPQTVAVNKPAVVSQQWTFADPNPDGAVAVVTIVNGLPNGTQKCARGTVTLNGATVVTSKQFAGLPSLITARVSLQYPAFNTLAVASLSGKPSCQMAISIQDLDATPPTITAYIPTQDELFCPANVVQAAGHIDDRTAKITVNGQNCPHYGVNAFDCIGFPITTFEGVDSIQIGATDYCGNTTAVPAISITVDDLGPAFTVTSPPAGYVSCLSRDVLLAGMATDATAFTVQDLNGQVWTGTPTMFWFQESFPQDGTAVVGVSGTDACGTVSKATQTIVMDAGAPSVTVVPLAVVGVTAAGWLYEVSGTYAGVAASIEVNGQPVAYSGGTLEGTVQVPNVQGNLPILTVTEVDACGRSASSCTLAIGGELSACSMIGPAGGELTLPSGAGLIVSQGALAATTPVWGMPGPGLMRFPRHLEEVGPEFELGPPGLAFSQPVTVVLPISGTVTPGIGLNYRAFAMEEGAAFMGEIPTSSVDQVGGFVYATATALSRFAPAFAFADFSTPTQLSDGRFMSFRSRPAVSRNGAEMMAYINSYGGLSNFAPVERTWKGSGWTPEVQVGPWQSYPLVVENTLIEIGVGSDGSELPFYFYDVENVNDGSVGMFSTFYAGTWSPIAALPWGGSQLFGWSPLPIFDSAGAWHMFFQDQSDPSRRVWEAVSTDQGGTWSSPMIGGPYIPGTAGMLQGPYTAAATGAEKQIYLVPRATLSRTEGV